MASRVKTISEKHRWVKAPDGRTLHLQPASWDQVVREVAALYTSLDGDASVTYAGQREEDGVKVFVLHVKADLSRTGEYVPSSEYTSEHGGTPGAKFKGEFTTQVEGDLLWSVEHAHLISLTLEGKAAVTEGVSYERGGQSVEMVRKFSGTTRYSFAVERAD